MNTLCSYTQRGKAFCSVPAVSAEGEVYAPMDFLLQKLQLVCASAPPGGVFVASTDVLLLIPDGLFKWYALLRNEPLIHCMFTV